MFWYYSHNTNMHCTSAIRYMRCYLLNLIKRIPFFLGKLDVKSNNIKPLVKEYQKTIFFIFRTGKFDWVTILKILFIGKSIIIGDMDQKKANLAIVALNVILFLTWTFLKIKCLRYWKRWGANMKQKNTLWVLSSFMALPVHYWNFLHFNCRWTR